MSTEPKAADTARTGSGALRRPPLSRKRIIETAIDFVDRRGLIALTMRRLGEELGVEAMSLYRYVNGRQDLLEGIVDQMVAHLHLRPGQAPLQPTDGWQVYLRWLAHGVRELTRTHPNAFPLLATRHPAAPWLRPPLRSLRVVEEFLAMLSSKGFSDVRVVVAYRAFSSFLLGHLLHEVSLLGAQTSPARSRRTKPRPRFFAPTGPSTSTGSPTSNDSRPNCPKTAPRPSSSKHWKTCSTDSTG